jgi:uncharacterized protein
MTSGYDATNVTAQSGGRAAAHSAPSAVENIFKGPNGIRAGWRLLIFLAIFIVLVRGVGLIPAIHNFANAQDRQTMTPAALILLEGVSLVCLFVAAGLMSLIEKKTFADYHLPLNQAFGKRFWQGAPYGFAMLSLLLVLIAAFHGFSLGNLALSGADAMKYGALYGIGFILVGLFEEFSFRGYMQSTAASGIGFWPAAVALSIVFGASHLQNLGEGWSGALMAGSFGILAAFSLTRTGNIWFPIGMHAAWDWGETYFYSVPDSGFLAKGHLLNSTFHGASWLTGGTVGPEGSVFAFVVLLIGGVGIHFLFPAKRLSQ